MSEQSRRAAFPTTRISLILAARDRHGPSACEALSLLCQSYWFPIYAFLRRHGHPHEAAEDLTQGFFAQLLEKRYLDDFEERRGRFRSYLLTALKHYAANQRDRHRAQKRGGAVTLLPLEDAFGAAERRYDLEPRTDLTPEREFERQWALSVLARVDEQLAAEESQSGRGVRFERLKRFLAGDGDDRGYRAAAVDLQTTEGAVKVAVHRLRRRFRDLLREEVGHTVANPGDVGDELRHLLTAL